MSTDNCFDQSVSRGEASKRRRCGRKPTPLLVHALSSEEWNYLHGLFLTDGCSFVGKVRGLQRDYRVQFYLGGNEANLVSKVVELLRRSGLHPYTQHSRKSKMVIVIVDSKSLYRFLPTKKLLMADPHQAEVFLEEHRLFEAQFGVPFLAGLLDGDGHCLVRITRRKDLVFGEVRPWRWHFTQKKLPFLASYLLGFVESLVRGGARTEGRRDGSQRVVFRKRGIEALLAASVAEHSIRVAQWLRRLTEVRAERAGYYTSGQIANVLGVDRRIVLQWLDTGSVRYVRFGKWRYIPARALHKLTWLS